MDPNSLLHFDNRIHVPSTGNLYTCILQYHHDHILASHFSQNKTLNLFAMDIPSLVSVLMYNNSTSSILLVCNLNYNITSINFIEKLLYPPDLILSWSLSTGLPSRWFLSLPTTPSHLWNLAYLFVLHMFSKHSVSFYVISDRGLEFLSNFFHSLGTTSDMQLHFTSGHYSESDKQTKHMNQTLKQYLHIL